MTNVSSVQYLTRPRDFFAEVHRVLRPGGVATVAFSNRTFAEKTVAVWLRDASIGPALTNLVADYILSATQGEGLPPWAHVTAADLSPPGGGDPLWIVVAVK